MECNPDFNQWEEFSKDICIEDGKEKLQIQVVIGDRTLLGNYQKLREEAGDHVRI